MNPSSSKEQQETPYQLGEDVSQQLESLQDPSQFDYQKQAKGIPIPVQKHEQYEQDVIISDQRTPVKTRCPHCGHLAQTRISNEYGFTFWYVLCCMPCGLCIVVCDEDECSDVIHHCQECNRELGRIPYQLCKD